MMLLTSPLLGTQAASAASATPTGGSAWGLASSAAGLASSMVGAYYSAQSAKLQAETNSYISNVNAKITELGAATAKEQGRAQVAAISQQAGEVKSSQRASLAARGVDLGAGSAAEVQASTDINKEADMHQAKVNAALSAWGYSSQAANLRTQSFTQQAQASTINPAGSAFSSLLGGAGQVAQQWYAYNKSGSY